MNSNAEPSQEWEVRLLATGKNLKIFHKGERASSGCVAFIPIRDSRKTTVFRDAALIAAAPHLLAALEAIVEEVEGPAESAPYSADSYLPQHFIDLAKAAIGRTHATT